MKTFGKLVVACGLVALMTTPAWAQRGGFGGPGMLLSNKSVQQEIKASSDQASKMDALGEEIQAKVREKLQDVAKEQRRERMQAVSQEMQAEINRKLDDILKPDQVKRFHQVQVQAEGTRAFDRPGIAERLKLTDDQRSKVREINEDLMTSQREVFQNAGGNREEAMKKLSDLRKEALGKVMALLTDSQKTTYKDLTGEPFEIKFEPRNN